MGQGTAIGTYQHTCLLYNPRAGRLLRDSRLIPRAVAALESAGHQVHACPTTGPNTASALARRCVEGGADLILACGGDGTVNEVVNGMVRSAVPLGVLPAGTANVLAAELGVPRGIERAAATVSAWVPRRVALGRLQAHGLDEPRYFLLMAGLGMDAHIVYNIHLGLKATFGKLSYWLSGFGLFGRPLPEFEARLEGQTVRTSFALASRVRNYGGDLWIARNASLLSDDFEVVLFEGRNAAVYVRYLAGIMAGSHGRMSGVTLARSRRVDFLGSPLSSVYVQVDGEFAGKLPASVEIESSALTLLVPPHYPGAPTNGRG